MNAFPPASPPVPGSRATVASTAHAASVAVVDRAYRQLVEELPLADLLRNFCHGLAEAMHLPLVMLAHRDPSGTLEIEASSRENLLWAELMRLPERWDGTIAGNGPAARALHDHVPVSMRVVEDGFLPWREAARRDGIAQVWAWPLETRGRDWALLLCSASAVAASDEDAMLQELGGQIATACARLVEASERVARERLLAAALRHSGNAAFIADTGGRIAWCNAAFSRLTGYPLDEVIGRNPRFLSSGHHAPRHYRELWNTIRTGGIWRGETVDRDREGVAFTAIQTITPFGLGDRVTHYLALYEDVSGQKTEQTRRELRAGHDPLTGLLHRAALEFQLAEQLARARPLQLALISARRIPAIEALGGQAVEAFLDEMQARIARIVGADRAARTAAGEYLVQLPDDIAEADAMIDTLRRELLEPYPLIGEVAGLDLRIGRAAAPADGEGVDALVHHADRALGAEPLEPARRRLPFAAEE